VYYGVGYEGIMTFWRGWKRYANTVWKGQQPDSGEIMRGGSLMRKALIVGMYTTILVLLVVGLVFRNRGGSREYLQSIRERWAYP
jgi:hypothetical protein